MTFIPLSSFLPARNGQRSLLMLAGEESGSLCSCTFSILFCFLFKFTAAAFPKGAIFADGEFPVAKDSLDSVRVRAAPKNSTNQFTPLNYRKDNMNENCSSPAGHRGNFV